MEFSDISLKILMPNALAALRICLGNFLSDDLILSTFFQKLHKLPSLFNLGENKISPEWMVLQLFSANNMACVSCWSIVLRMLVLSMVL